MYKLLLLLVLLSADCYAQRSDLLAKAAVPGKAFDLTAPVSTDYHAPAYNRARSGSCTNGLTVTGNVLAAVGGGLIGWPCGTYLGGGDPEWGLAIAGAGVLAVAIPLAILGQRKCNGRYALEGRVNSMYAHKRPSKQLIFATSGNTVGLQLNF
ncbi:MAG: hypothetical protein KDC07_08100 [Chitinophagaceae bacterium]|nr:hypothetical protein [Chitinophagaceae bacterium]MCB9044944.1 hypothetical protein [Chitinophagales bacterium]